VQHLGSALNVSVSSDYSPSSAQKPESQQESGNGDDKSNDGTEEYSDIGRYPSLIFFFLAAHTVSRRTILIRHSRRGGTQPAMIVFEFHKPVNHSARRLLPASGLFGTGFNHIWAS
jgi:hypothetical protein